MPEAETVDWLRGKKAKTPLEMNSPFNASSIEEQLEAAVFAVTHRSY